MRAGLTLAAAAHAAGLSAGSGSTVSRWEDGSRPIKVMHLERLARAYGVPIDFLMHPDMTDDERLEAAAADAAVLEREDWEAERAARQPGGGGPAGGRHRRPA